MDRKFYVRRDGVNIGPFPTNRDAGEWVDRNLNTRRATIWEDEGRGSGHVDRIEALRERFQS
jgi:hypothetical protein